MCRVWGQTGRQMMVGREAVPAAGGPEEGLPEAGPVTGDPMGVALGMAAPMEEMAPEGQVEETIRRVCWWMQ